MSQPDFVYLAVQLEERVVASDEKADCISVIKQSDPVFLTESQEKCSMEVDFLLTEYGVRECIAGCEYGILTAAESYYPMGLNALAVSVSQDMFEPTRCLKSKAPPKRFYRTFWRSATRRILDFSSMQTMQDGPEI